MDITHSTLSLETRETNEPLCTACVHARDRATKCAHPVLGTDLATGRVWTQDTTSMRRYSGKCGGGALFEPKPPRRSLWE